MLLLLAASASAECTTPLTAAHLHQRVILALEGSPEVAAAVLDEVDCLTGWADPQLAADVLSLGERAGRAGEGWAHSTTLPDWNVCLWLANGVPLDGGVWQQPAGASLVQRRCTDDRLTTWYLYDSVLPEAAYVRGRLTGPTPQPALMLSLPVAEVRTARLPLTTSQIRLQNIGLISLSTSATSMILAITMRSRYRSGFGDANTLKILNGIFGGVGYATGAVGVVAMVNLERQRR